MARRVRCRLAVRHDPATDLVRLVHSGDGRAVRALHLGMMAEVMNRWLGYAKRVTAMEKTLYPTRPDPNGGADVPVERPDTLSVVAELENGALATLLFGFL